MTITYLDHAATTPLSKTALAAMLPFLTEHFANPSSSHRPGLFARRAVEAAREQVATHLDVPPASVVFTSGGTEANNLAIKGRMLTRRGERRHVVTTAVEHPSVRQALADLEAMGVPVTAVRPGKNGLVEACDVLAALRPETAMVVMIHGQNEVGALEPVLEVARLLREQDARIVLHVDAVQSFGKVPMPLKQSGITSIALSAHKIHGPKGVGALVMQDRPRLWPLVSGGGQEAGLRSGTENVAGIVGFGQAVAELPPATVAEQRLRALRDRANAGLRSIAGIQVLDAWPATLPHIVCFTILGVPGEVVLHHLEREHVFVSTGSACHAKSKHVSASALAQGLTEAQVRSMVRASFGLHTTIDEIDRLVHRVGAIARELNVAQVSG